MKKTCSIILFVFLAVFVSGCAAVATQPAPAAAEPTSDRSMAAAPAIQSAPAALPPVSNAPQPESQVEAVTKPETYDSSPIQQEAGKSTAVPLNNPSSPETEDWEETPAPVYDQGNEFQGYGINDYENTKVDNLSTFALDVDTASYSVARRYINDGNFPPAEAIRVEEFVNNFESGYLAPDESTFSLFADGAPSPFINDGTYLLRFGVKGYEVPDYARKPLSLTFVIDVSGSMGDKNRLGLVKDSLKLLVKRLKASDTVAIVVYGSDARIELNPVSGSHKQEIMQVIGRLHPESSTNVEAGLRLGYETAMGAYNSDGTNRVILCSDGVANTGNTSANGILDYIHGYVDEGITLTAMGFGMGNFNDALLEQLADRGNGNYYYIDTIDQAKELFVENLTSTLQIIARDAKVQVEFNPEVVSYYRLIGYENRDVADEDFRNDSVDAGEIGAGHSVTAIYAVHFNKGTHGRIATIQLRWQDPESYEVSEIYGDFATRDLSRTFEKTASQYQRAVIAMQFAELLRESPWGVETDITLLSRYAADLKSQMHDEDTNELADLIHRVDRLKGNGWPW